jgi:hypothetical protein
MENSRALLITFDMSGYYDGVRRELQRRYDVVDYYNMAAVSYKYKSVFEKGYAFFLKLFTGRKLKNYLKYRSMIEAVSANRYDVALVVRPDLLFDSQIQSLRKTTSRFVTYYHDSINNIPRKKDVIHFFDKVWSYERKDAAAFDLGFTPNFIYFENAGEPLPVAWDGFSVMSEDYRVKTLKNVARYFRNRGRSYRFYVADDKPHHDQDVTYITRRMKNPEVIEHIKQSGIIVDIHKFGIQDGLTFRTFEAMGFEKKLVTTNRDIATYDFYDPQNIFIIEDHEKINIPDAFFDTPYRPIPPEIYSRYTIPSWLDRVLAP